jgi:hypothetical protein
MEQQVAPAPADSAPAQPGADQGGAATATPAPPSATPHSQPASGTAKARPAPAPSLVPPAATAATAAAAPVAPAATQPSRAPVAAPPLDLNGLEQRLRDTRAIGLFTKLSLKNQVDDLLAQFKAFHQGQSQSTLGQLRQRYEVLLMKVVTLLQDGDPSLANAVLSSREAIWGVLTDPKRLSAI